MSPWNHSPQIVLPPIFSALVDATSEPAMTQLAGLDAVHVERSTLPL